MKTKYFVPLALALFSLAGCTKQSNGSESISADSSHAGIWKGRDLPENTVLGASVVGLRTIRGANVYSCTGTLIEKNVVLTAAHCIFEAKIENIKIYFGIRNDESNSKVLSVVKSMMPKSYVKSDGFYKPGKYDFAVLRLSGDAPEGFEPAPLIAMNYIAPEQQLIQIAGYGITGLPETSGILRGTVSYATKMNKNNPEMFSDVKIYDTGVCSGDSGGPVFIKQNGTYILAGVVNGILGEITEEYPCGKESYFANLLYYGDTVRTWTQEILKD